MNPGLFTAPQQPQAQPNRLLGLAGGMGPAGGMPSGQARPIGPPQMQPQQPNALMNLARPPQPSGAQGPAMPPAGMPQGMPMQPPMQAPMQGRLPPPQVPRPPNSAVSQPALTDVPAAGPGTAGHYDTFNRMY